MAFARASLLRMAGTTHSNRIYDNMKTAVSTVFVGKKRDYNRRFQEMCTHHQVLRKCGVGRWAGSPGQ